MATPATKEKAAMSTETSTRRTTRVRWCEGGDEDNGEREDGDRRSYDGEGDDEATTE